MRRGIQNREDWLNFRCLYVDFEIFNVHYKQKQTYMSNDFFTTRRLRQVVGVYMGFSGVFRKVTSSWLKMINTIGYMLLPLASMHMFECNGCTYETPGIKVGQRHLDQNTFFIGLWKQIFFRKFWATPRPWAKCLKMRRVKKDKNGPTAILAKVGQVHFSDRVFTKSSQ